MHSRLKELMREAEEILSRNTDLSQLKDLTDVELETRRRIHEYVAPELMAFLSPRVAGLELKPRHSQPGRSLIRTLQTTLGKLKLTLADRVRGRPGVETASFIADGRAGVWNLMDLFRPKQDSTVQSPGREILDWYHLKENVHKFKWSQKRKERVCELLWQGEVDRGLTQEVPNAGHRLHKYLQRHHNRIVPYSPLQDAGEVIGSGAVESSVKQIDARMQLPGAGSG